MRASSILAVAAAIFSSACQAMPFAKRDLVIVTDVEDVYETVHVVTTVWVGVTPATATPTPDSDMSVAAVVPSSPYSIKVPDIPATTPAPVVPSPSAISEPSVPTPTPSPAPVTSSRVAAPSPSPSTSPSGSKYSGKLTFYTDNVGATSCGYYVNPGDNIVALSNEVMNNPANPNANPMCGKMITISHNGKQMQAKVSDTCAGCDSSHIDLSSGLFSQFADLDAGVVQGAEWWFDE